MILLNSRVNAFDNNLTESSWPLPLTWVGSVTVTFLELISLLVNKTRSQRRSWLTSCLVTQWDPNRRKMFNQDCIRGVSPCICFSISFLGNCVCDRLDSHQTRHPLSIRESLYLMFLWHVSLYRSWVSWCNVMSMSDCLGEPGDWLVSLEMNELRDEEGNLMVLR